MRVSAISILEIAIATSLNRLNLRPSAADWLKIAQSFVRLRVEPLTDEICLESVSLPGTFHRDPADRIIVALARLLDVELVTNDGKILRYNGVKTIPAS